MNKFFSNIKFYNLPVSNAVNIISCDDHYWKKYGIFNVFSCNDTNQDIHVHIINPLEDSIHCLSKLKKTLNINITFSYEFFDTDNLNFYFLKSYYYVSRFFVALYIFDNTDVQELRITDADIIFNNKVDFLDNIHLALSYRPDRITPWEKTAAYFLYIRKEYKFFLSSVICSYKQKVQYINFNEVEKIKNKIEKANYTGLDQVCLTEELEKEKIFEDKHFLNLDSLSNFSSKGELESKIWVLVGKTKKALDDNYLTVKYKNYFREE